MAIIRVPAPAPQSFRKDRPISDLVKSQIRYFQHLEHKLQLSLPTKFNPQNLTTEAAAAQYIAEMTTALRGPTPEVTAPLPVPSRQKPDSTPAARPRPKAARHPRETSAATAATPKVRKAKKRTAKKQPRKKS